MTMGCVGESGTEKEDRHRMEWSGESGIEDEARHFKLNTIHGSVEAVLDTSAETKADDINM